MNMSLVHKVSLSLAALGLLLLAALPARAQNVPSQCFNPIAPKIISGTSYTVSTSDNCWLVLLTNTGAITVSLPAPGLIFGPGRFTTTFLALNGGTISFVNLADQSGIFHKINQASTLTLSAGQGVTIQAQQDLNWYAFPNAVPGSGSGSVINVQFVGDGVVDSSTPTPPCAVNCTLTATLLAQTTKTVLAGPTSGSPSLPTFRQLSCADLSDAAAGCSSGGVTVPTADLLGGAANTFTTVHVSTGLTLSAGNLTRDPIACAGLTDDGTACVANTGTSGHTLPFLDGNNTFSGNNVHTGSEQFAETLGAGRTSSATTETLTAADCGTTIFYTSNSAVTVTIPASMAPANNIVCYMNVAQMGTAKVSVNGSAVTPVTLRSDQSFTGTSGTQYNEIGLTISTISGTATAVLTGSGS